MMVKGSYKKGTQYKHNTNVGNESYYEIQASKRKQFDISLNPDHRYIINIFYVINVAVALFWLLR